jgi:hypothetical protein
MFIIKSWDEYLGRLVAPAATGGRLAGAAACALVARGPPAFNQPANSQYLLATGADQILSNHTIEHQPGVPTRNYESHLQKPQLHRLPLQRQRHSLVLGQHIEGQDPPLRRRPLGTLARERTLRLGVARGGRGQRPGLVL